jgi:ketosteroid isomerase-like protein
VNHYRDSVEIGHPAASRLEVSARRNSPPHLHLSSMGHAHVWKIRDGKVVSFQQYVDTAQLQDVECAR